MYTLGLPSLQHSSLGAHSPLHTTAMFSTLSTRARRVHVRPCGCCLPPSPQSQHHGPPLGTPRAVGFQETSPRFVTFIRVYLRCRCGFKPIPHRASATPTTLVLLVPFLFNFFFQSLGFELIPFVYLGALLYFGDTCVLQDT